MPKTMKPRESTAAVQAPAEEEQIFWARIRPKNPRQGCYVERFSVSNKELGLEPADGSLVFEGGDGITQVPTWYKVTRAQAQVLATKVQPRTSVGGGVTVFQIVNDEVREQIDQAEETARLRIVSVGNHAIQSITDPQVSALLGTMDANVRHGAVQRTLNAG